MQRERASEQRSETTFDKAHGRRETRTITTTTSLNHHARWPHLSQVCRIERERVIREVRTREVAYYITSLPRRRPSAKRLLELSRRHWGAIENGLHYVRDMAFGEDRCTIFRGHAAENFATVRNGALNLLRSQGIRNITATLRSFARNSHRVFAEFGYVE
jgi:predicted transposase YbfD/YdcC